jgi:acetyl esterase/lipase
MRRPCSGESLLDDSRRIHDAIRAAGGHSTLEIFDGVFHVWHMLDGLIPESRQALRRAAAFMNGLERFAAGEH